MNGLPNGVSGIAGRTALAGLVFVAAAVSPAFLSLMGAGSLLERNRWLSYVAVKTILILVSLVLIKLEGRDFARCGFRRASAGVRWGHVTCCGLGLGAAAATLVFVTPARGMTWLMKDLGLLGLVTCIWLYSSLSEEIFTRGWYQSSLSAWDGTVVRKFGKEVEVPVLASGLLFGAMHLSLLVRGADYWTTAIIVLATTTLGWVAANLRHRSGSLVPAILVHVCFNVGGFLAGVILAIGKAMLTG